MKNFAYWDAHLRDLTSKIAAIEKEIAEVPTLVNPKMLRDGHSHYFLKWRGGAYLGWVQRETQCDTFSGDSQLLDTYAVHLLSCPSPIAERETFEAAVRILKEALIEEGCIFPD